MSLSKLEVVQDVEMEDLTNEPITDNEDDKIVKLPVHVFSLPSEVKQKIFFELDNHALRQASQSCRHFKNLSDDVPKVFKLLKFESKRKNRKDFICISQELSKTKFVRMEFHHHKDGYLMRNWAEKYKKVVVGDDDYVAGAMQFLRKVTSDYAYMEEMIIDLLPLRFLNPGMYEPEEVEKWNGQQQKIIRAFQQFHPTSERLQLGILTINFDGDSDDLLAILRNVFYYYIHTLILRRDGFKEHGILRDMDMSNISSTPQFHNLRVFKSDYVHPAMNFRDIVDFTDTSVDFFIESLEEFKEIFIYFIDQDLPATTELLMESVWEDEEPAELKEYIKYVNRRFGRPTESNDTKCIWKPKKRQRDVCTTSVSLDKIKHLFRIVKEEL